MSRTNANNLQQSIFDAVDTIVSRRIKEIDYDKTIIGIIKTDAGLKNGRKIYKVEYAGGFFYAYCLDSSDSYIPNTKVYISVPQGDFSKDKIIIGRVNTINTSSNFNLVTSAMSNYTILGKNPLKLKDEDINEAGVRSYHLKNSEEKTQDPHPISHRYNILYGNKDAKDDFVTISDEEKEALLAYANEGTAIMVRADFRTDLPTEQRNQAAARYGLSFKLKFKNENAGWGETQWDILNNIGKEITEKIEIPNFFEPQSITLSDIVMENDELINKTLNEDNLSEIIIAQDGELSQRICLIEELYRVFVANNSVNNLEIIEETFRAYDILLKELQTYSNVDEIKTAYENWQKVKVETEEFKIVPCLLDSNKMVGAPLYFKKPTTQYAIFEADLTNFVGIEEIALFKEHFIENESKDIKDDIFVENIQFLILEPLDTVSGDYALKVESLTTGPTVSNEDDFATFTATLNRKIYEDLSASSNTSFYWFKEDPSVYVGGPGYHIYGGKGWSLLHSIEESKRIFKTTFGENPSKKNKYKCVVIYKENEDSNITLECPFIVYNTTQGELIELESDLGTVFQFDVGIPTITCLISGQETNIKKEINTNEKLGDYKFYWSLITEDDQEILLYDNLVEDFNWKNLDLDNFSTYQMQETYLRDIAFFDSAGNEVSNSLDATRLQYPMVNINTGSKVTIKCTVVLEKEEENETEDSEKTIVTINQGSGELVFENRKTATIAGYRIVFEHDNQVFQYDEYGNSPVIKTKLDPQEILPIRAKLVGPNGLEISGTNIQVDWIFPIESTMIIPLENSLTLNPEDGLENLLKNSNNCTFMINDQYNPDAINNQITCRIKYKDINYYKDTNLFFRKIGENGTNGTDVTVRIFPISSATILNEQPLTLYTYPEEETIKGFFNDNAYFSNNGIEEITLTGDNGYLQTEVYQKGQLVNTDKYSLMWNLAGNPSESINSKSNIFDIELDRENQTNIIKWSATANQQINKKDYRLQNIKSHVIMTDAAGVSQEYYGYYPLPVIEYKSEKPAIYANRRITIDKKTYLKEITYNADGRNPIYNHNQGLKIINLPIGSTVIWKAKGGWTKEENNPDFGLTFEKNDNIKDTNSILESNLENQTEALIYIVPKDETTGSSTNNRIEAEIYVNNNLYAIIYAPIIITLNTFGLASLNAWDGNSVTIDEEGGYIMAPQIGAGEKDTNNRFTGIVMGKTETYTGGGDKEKQIGLFGYAHGLQSIFLDSETGNATFGLPDVYNELDEDGNVVRKYQHTNRNSDDDYNEGRIELRPGDVSKIGGWRLGRRSFYYIQDDKDIGPKYNNDYIPDRAGTIRFGDRYNSHHEKDIQEDSAGILLHSGNYPYLSIKGKKLDIEKDQLSDSSLSYLLDGDSLEVQIDPYTPTLFTIFRHNGQARYKDTEKTELLYPEGSRTYLAGINARGQLVANGLQNVTTPTSGSEGDTVTTFGVNAVPAFGEYFETATHIGLMMDAADQMISKIFVKNIQEKDSTLYITGSGTQNNEYIRPISLNGKSIGLFASTNASIATTTDANIQISTNNYQAQLGNTQFKLTRENDNLLETRGKLDINLGAIGNRKALGINAASSNINLYTGNTNYYNQTIDDTNGIKITTTKSYNYTSTNTNYNINLNNIKINASNNKLQLFNSGSTYTNSILLNNDNGTWETGHNLTLQNTNQLKIYATNTGNGSQYSSSRSWGQIVFQAGTVTENETAAQLFLNSSNNTWKTGYSYTDSDGKKQTKTAGGSKTNSWFRINETRRNQGIYLYDTVETTNNKDTVYTYFGIDAHQLSLAGQFSMQQQADKLFFKSTNFSGTSGSMTCNITASNLKSAIDELAERIAQVADAFNKHTHKFSDSSSKTVSWTAPTHTVLSSVSVSGKRKSVTVNTSTNPASITENDATNFELSNITTSNLSSSENIWGSAGYQGSSTYVGGSTVSASGSTKSVGGESHSETVTLTVNQTIGVPENQKIKDSDF